MTRDGDFESLCDVCGNNVNDRFCSANNSNFMDSSMSSTDDCDDYEFLDDDGEDDNGDNTDYTEPIDCPGCGGDAYWNGSEYECDECGWTGI